MAYARRSAARKRVASPRRRTARVVRRAAPARRTTRRAAPRRAASGRGQTVRLVIEHQNANSVQRPEMSGMVATRNTKRAKF